jgi:hypothetical protein
VPLALLAAAGVRILLWTFSGAAAVLLVFLAATGFTTQRYEVDFLPLAVLTAIACLGIHVTRSQGFRRAALGTVLAVTVIWGASVNLGLAVTGPYEEMLAKRPEAYVRMAQWFSPIAEFRPMFKPRVEVEFSKQFGTQRELLATVGRHSLYAEHLAGKVRLVCGAVAKDIGTPREAQIRVAYAPESERLTAAVNGEEVLTEVIGPLVTAPAEVIVGEGVRNVRKVVR